MSTRFNLTWSKSIWFYWKSMYGTHWSGGMNKNGKETTANLAVISQLGWLLVVIHVGQISLGSTQSLVQMIDLVTDLYLMLGPAINWMFKLLWLQSSDFLLQSIDVLKIIHWCIIIIIISIICNQWLLSLPNLESKSSATSHHPVLGSGSPQPPISDSSFPLHFGLLPPLGRILLRV